MSTRRPVVAGNWKMNKTAMEATQLLQQLFYHYDNKFDSVDVVVCPPFTALRSAQVVLEFDNNAMIQIGAQDVYWEPQGAYTGAISAGMLKDVSCSYCIIGHSERREYFHETDEDIARKNLALIEAGITPILCCGESLEVHDEGSTIEFVTGQITAGLSLLSAEAAKPVVIAYEPIWAIGTGRTPSPEEADEVCGALRATYGELYGAAAAEAVRILYGGSMNPGNVDALSAMPNIDGGLIGGAALKVDDFLTLVKAFS